MVVEESAVWWGRVCYVVLGGCAGWCWESVSGALLVSIELQLIADQDLALFFLSSGHSTFCLCKQKDIQRQSVCAACHMCCVRSLLSVLVPVSGVLLQIHP